MEKVIVKGYEVVLYWDKDDSIYVAEARALPGCMTHGDSQEAAVAEMKVAIDGHIEVCKEQNRAFKKPMPMYA